MRVTQAQIGKDTSLHRAGVQEIAAGRLLIAILYNKRAWRQRWPAQLRPIMDYERAAIKHINDQVFNSDARVVVG